MSTFLTKQQIRSLYGVTDKKGELVVHGRTVKNTMTSSYRAQVEADAKTMTHSELWAKHYDYLSKLKTTPSVTEIRSEVSELI